MALTRATDKIIANADGNLNLSGIVTATSFSGSGANLTSLPAANLTGTLPAISGANLTGIDATAIKFGSDVKVQANNSGATVTGILTVSGNLSVGGTITYEDVTNVDSVGVVTARNGIKIGPAAGVAGTFFADGSYVTAGIITATSFSGSGANLTGISQVGGSTGVDFNDNVKIRLGTGNDLQIYHDGSHSRLVDAGTGYIKIQSNQIALLNADDSEQMAQFNSNGAVELYFNNVMKITTLNNGARVNGNFVINDGSQLQLQNPNANRTSEIVNGGSSTNSDIQFRTNGSHRVSVTKDGHFEPATNNAYDLGTSSYRWRNVYTNDLNLSNEGSTNSVDNTWGNYTIQEGESDLFLINNRNGKKYKFNLTEVS